MNKPTLIFVYNADSGLLNTLLDIGHKIISPRTYACNLCAITHSTFRMRDEWKQFVAGLGVPVEFLHRDELTERYGMRDLRLPAVLRRNNGMPETWITQEEINRCRTLEELAQLVRVRLTVEE